RPVFHGGADHHPNLGGRRSAKIFGKPPEGAPPPAFWGWPPRQPPVLAPAGGAPPPPSRLGPPHARHRRVAPPPPRHRLATPVHADRALALAVCTAHGVSAEVAGPAMDTAAPDPASFLERALDVDGRTVRFANAFSCNDVASLALLWPTVNAVERPVVLLNA